jgi:hypothetical protein
MSSAIDVSRVAEVLLVDGKWHPVANRSFELDSYEYVRDVEVKPGGGSADVELGGGQELVATFGASWLEEDSRGNTRRIFCPMTAIQAISYELSKSQRKE